MAKNKILVNSAIVTEDWKKYVGGTVKILICSVIGLVSMLLAGLLWLISLGHINLVQPIDSWMQKIID